MKNRVKGKVFTQRRFTCQLIPSKTESIHSSYKVLRSYQTFPGETMNENMAYLEGRG